jgi:hypothetical protein
MISLISYLNGIYIGCENFTDVIKLHVTTAYEGLSGMADRWEKRFPGLEYYYEGIYHPRTNVVTWTRVRCM